MNLFLLRHAQAEPRGPKWRPDSRRPLTPEGEEKMEKAARGMAALELSFDLILASPYARALRTAEIVAEIFGSKKLLETAHLAADADPKDIVDELNGNFASLENVILVGHEPFLTRLISTLLGGGDALAIDLKKGGLCKLTVEKLVFGRCACLNWLLTPRQLVRLAAPGKD
jgi:phosphohistidine phosphatase